VEEAVVEADMVELVEEEEKKEEAKEEVEEVAEVAAEEEEYDAEAEVAEQPPPPTAFGARTGRGVHSSTSQLNLSRFGHLNLATTQRFPQKCS
jgi:hypothetical protein